MSVIRVGSTTDYAAGWENVFGNEQKTAKKSPGNKKRTVKKTSTRKAKKKKKSVNKFYRNLL